MNISISTVKKEAKKDLKNKFGYAILTDILLNVIRFFSYTIGLLFGGFLCGGAVSISRVGSYIEFARRGEWDTNQVYKGFNKFGTAFASKLLMSLIYLGCIVVFGLIFLLCWKVTQGNREVRIVLSVFVGVVFLVAMIWINLQFIFLYHIIYAFPDLTAGECIKKAFNLVFLREFAIIKFYFSYIGWLLLSIVTLGATFLYVMPYYNTAKANLFLAYLLINEDIPKQWDDEKDVSD